MFTRLDRKVMDLIYKLSRHKRPDESWMDFVCRVYRKLQARTLAKRQVGREELKQLKSVIKSGNLFHGPKVEQFRKEFAQVFGVRYAITSTSGTAAVHVAVAMINPNPGDEIITSSITDMGTIIPIIYQNAIPIFADIHPETWTMHPEAIEKAITQKTKAIIAVHLFGNPCDMNAIMDIAQRYNLPVIEDCAQAHLSEYKRRLVGTIGDIGCFSFQQTKHMITGDGGMTITDNLEYGEKGVLFVDKGWNRSILGARQYTMLGMNYRMTELQAAVGIAQLRKLKNISERRNRNGTLLTELMLKIDGIKPQQVSEGNKNTYWFYGLTVNSDAPFTADALAQSLSDWGVPTIVHYIGKPIFMCSEPLMKKQFYGNTHFPFDYSNARQDIIYEPGVCPIAEDILNCLVVLQLTERYSEKQIRNVANRIDQTVNKLSRYVNTPGWQPSNKGKYRAGIIGCGVIARQHVMAYQAQSVTVSAIADINPDALKTIASEFSISTYYNDYREMLATEALDIVSITTWPGLHAEMTIAAAEHGVKAILCEKPMALNLDEADRMIDACKQSGAKLIIGHQHRFNPHFTEAKQLIESGAIGKPHLVWGHCESSLLNNGTHIVDTIRYILGDPKTDWVLGQIERKKDSYNRGHRVEEIAEALVHFSNGVRGVIEMGDLATPAFEFHIYGDSGQLNVTVDKLLLQNNQRKGAQVIQHQTGKEYIAEVAEIVSCLDRDKDEHRGNAYQARMTLEILMAIFESVRTHGVVRPPLTTKVSPLDIMVESGIL